MALLRTVVHFVDLPIQPGIRPLPARVGQRLAVNARASGRVKFELGGELVELLGQRRFKLVQDVFAKQAAQHPTCQQQGDGQPHQRRRQQPKAQRMHPMAGRGYGCHRRTTHSGGCKR